MFSFGRRDEVSPNQILKLALSSPKNVTPSNNNGRKKETNNSNNKNRLGRGRNNTGAHNRRSDSRLHRMNVHDTTDGVEVSLDFNAAAKGGGPASPSETREPPQVPYRRPLEPVISLPQQIRQRQRVHKTQFSTNFAATTTNAMTNFSSSHNAIPSSSSSSMEPLKSNGSFWSFNTAKQSQASNSMPPWRPKGHRIPLQGAAPVEAAYEDVLNLLQHSLVTDEYSSVHQELEQIKLEMEALERDREYLQALYNDKAATPTAMRSPTMQSLQSSSTLSHHPTAGPMDWNVQKLLDSALLADAERKQLEAKRGNCFTISFGNARAKEVFVTKCGAKLSQLLFTRTHTSTSIIKPGNLGFLDSASRLMMSDSSGGGSGDSQSGPPGECITLGPHNCRPGGAATNVRQCVLLKDSISSHPSAVQHLSYAAANGIDQHQVSGFFISRDTGKAQTWGRIPPKLFRRLQKESGEGEGKVSSPCDIGDLVYLSTGPMGCYYAEFRSGETWWGSSAENDVEFHTILQSWDVFKVVFGPIVQLDDDDRNANHSKFFNSWVILGKDGRIAWKNIPRRLHERLERRLANWAAIADISLGPGGSYFCRFLDGSIDYCLPASIASVCEYIERNGGSITEVALHPEISNDFLIRHTELQTQSSTR